MIFYFSATGNSKYVALRIAEAIGDEARYIPGFGDTVYELSEGETLGIVTPTYFWELPSVMREFLKRIDIRGASGGYIFGVSTYGTTPGASGAEIRHILKAKGLEVSALYSVRMTDTWTPMFDLSDKEKVARVVEAAEQEIDSVIRAVKLGKRGNMARRSVPYAATMITDRFYESMRKTERLGVDDSCVGCGLCAKKCPVGAIEMRGGRPVWTAGKCAMCLGCLHRCPKFAISCGSNTKKHGQYQHPKAKV